MSNQYKKIITIFCLCTLLASCKVGPDYQKPSESVPGKWFSALSATPTLDDKAAIEQTWWKHFNDPTLDELIAKASSGNFDLKIAEARIAEARASRASARADLIPTVNTTGSAEREGNTLAFGNAPFDLTKPFNVFQTGFDASWELDLFGGKRREVESASAELSAAEASRDDVRVSLLAEVARTYVDIRQYQAQLAIAGDSLKADESSVKIATERFKSGTAPKLDVTQAQAQLEQVQSQVPYYQNLLSQAEFSMDVLLGEQPGATATLVATTQPIPVSDKNLILAAPAQVIANRPDIHVAERKLASATAQQGVATAQFFPDVSLSGFLGLLNSDAGNLLRGSSKSWSIAGSVTWPILNYSKLTANMDMAKASQQEALATYQKSIISALSDVERSLTAYTREEEHHESLGKVVADNAHALDIARMRYKQGLTSFFEVLDAERTLYASQSQAATSSGLVSQNLIAVYKSLGGGWQTSTSTATKP